MGTIIGAGIFKLAPDVAANAGSFSMTLLIWIVGGMMAMSGAICFAELSTRFPGQLGGDYVYLKAAYGKPIAFMFAWTAFWIIRPGNICIMALVFAEYFSQAARMPSDFAVWIAVSVVVLLSTINLAGLKPGSRTQNALTMAKVAGIGCVIALPFVAPMIFDFENIAATSTKLTADDSIAPQGSWLLAIVFVMFTMGGWNDVTLVAGEIKNPQVNLLKALVAGTAGVTLIYLLFNIALYAGLGYEALSESKTVATDLVLSTAQRCGDPNVASFLRDYGGRLVAGLVCVSCLGAINGMILTSPRIYYSVGRDYPSFQFLARWNAQRSVPWQAVVAQAVVTIALTLITLGRANGIEEMVTATTPYFYGFFSLTIVTIFIFRRRDALASIQTSEIKKVPFYPLPPLVFLGVCGLMCYKAIDYVIWRELTTLSLVLGGLLAIGAVIAIIVPAGKEDS